MSERRLDARGPLLLSGLITLILWQFPWGRLALYPFTLMATYAHEMGHGLTALAVGGRFHSLLMFPDGSGVARHAVGSGAAAALVAAGGLVGPAVAGAILMASTRRASRARWVLFMLGIGMALSIILYVRGSFAQSFVGLVAVSLLLLARYTSTQVALLSVQFLGLQLCLAVFKDLDYMFSPGGYVGGRLMRSDSAAIAEVLLLPYWFWGALTAVFSFVVIGLGLRQVLKPTPPSPRT